MRRFKRRLSIGQFQRWRQLAAIAPFDHRHQDVMHAQQIVLLARAIGDNGIQVEDIVGSPFETSSQDDMSTILQAFSASG